MMHGIAERNRDNARTPMQWDDSKYAGFTARRTQLPPNRGSASAPNHVKSTPQRNAMTENPCTLSISSS